MRPGRRALYADLGRDLRAQAGGALDAVPVQTDDDVPGAPDPAPIRFHLVGDSNGNGSNVNGTGFAGGFRTPLEAMLRGWRADFDFCGAQITVPEGCTSGLWFTDTIAGASLVNAQQNFAGWVAAPGVGASDFILDGLGTNDIAGNTDLPALKTRRAALDAAYDAADPSRRGTIVTGVVPFVAGSSVGGSLTTWNATRLAYNQWLAGYCGAKAAAGYLYLDPAAVLALGEFQTDGVHETRLGQAVAGQNLATALDRLLGPRRGFVRGRPFKQRKWNAAVQCSANGDGLSVAAHPGFNPNAGSFGLTFDFHPTSLPAGPLSIVEYGQYNVTDFFALYAAGRDLNLYWNNVAGTIFGGGIMTATSGGTLTTNKWHRILVLLHAPTLTAGIYVNAQLIGLVQGLPAWNFAQRTMTLGKGPTFNAAQGYYSNVRAFQGSTVPRPGTMAGQLAAENDYLYESSVAPGGVAASFSLDGILIDNVNANPAFALVGGAAFTTAQPAGTTPLRPWEYGF